VGILGVCDLYATGSTNYACHLLGHKAAAQYLVHGGDAISLQYRPGRFGLEMTDRHEHFASSQLAAIREWVARMGKVEIKPMRVPRKQ
jgi:hypothetical protein